ncbi:MAG TPA: lysylphosphatidylglycerol synthase domain-containing protein [Euzebyales bacterium]|nr:lysylphosphatidylglycerol synthase domain-containing protein [Euzebyales bacterium]
MSSDGAGGRSRWVRVARVVWLVALAVMLARVLVVNRAAVADLAQVRRPWLLATALLAGFGQLVLNASFWRRALAASGARVRWRTILEATARSVPARYVPGSVWYAMSRAAMLRARGVGVGALAMTALLEGVLTVVVSLALGGALLGLAGRLPGRQLSGVAWVVVLVIATAPPALNRVLSRLARRSGTTAPALSWADHGALVAWLTAFWALSAVAFTCYLLAFDVDVPGPAATAGAFLVAWAIGYLTPIAPQGAGAFEVVVVALLVGATDGPLAVIVAGFRALIGVRDALAFTLGAWTGRSGAPPPARRAPEVSPVSRPAPAGRRSG